MRSRQVGIAAQNILRSHRKKEKKNPSHSHSHLQVQTREVLWLCGWWYVLKSSSWPAIVTYFLHSYSPPTPSSNKEKASRQTSQDKRVDISFWKNNVIKEVGVTKTPLPHPSSLPVLDVVCFSVVSWVCGFITAFLLYLIPPFSLSPQCCLLKKQNTRVLRVYYTDSTLTHSYVRAHTL